MKTKKLSHLSRLLSSSYKKRVGLTPILQWSGQNYNSEVNSMWACMLRDLDVTRNRIRRVLSLHSKTLERENCIRILRIITVQTNLWTKTI